MDDERTIEEQLASAREKLAAREGMKGYTKNCEAIRAEIARLESLCPDCGQSAHSPQS